MTTAPQPRRVAERTDALGITSYFLHHPDGMISAHAEILCPEVQAPAQLLQMSVIVQRCPLIEVVKLGNLSIPHDDYALLTAKSGVIKALTILREQGIDALRKAQKEGQRA